LCRPPHAGKVSEDNVKAQSEVASDVFQHDESWCQDANGSQDFRPQVSLIVSAFPQAGVTEWLAGVAAREDVYGLHLEPVHGGYVAEVGHVGVMVGKDAGGCLVVLDVPRD
jgi:hypothetical protein